DRGYAELSGARAAQPRDHGGNRSADCGRAGSETHRVAGVAAPVDDQGKAVVGPNSFGRVANEFAPRGSYGRIASIWRLTLASAFAESDSMTAWICTRFRSPNSRFGPR